MWTALWRAGGPHRQRLPLPASENGNFPMMYFVPLPLIPSLVAI